MIYGDVNFDTYFKNYPNNDGFFGKYGGAFISDELKGAMEEITDAYFTICKSTKFIGELRRIRREFQGRPTPISHLERLSASVGNVQLYAKREDLNHTGAHKLNHCMGEALLAKYMGTKKVIAETGAGQHGVALATAAAYFGLECDIYMGSVDIAKQAPNVARMKILGANVIEVKEGTQYIADGAFDPYYAEYSDARFEVLTCITLPHSIKYIGHWAFSGCPVLEELVFEGTRAEWAQVKIEKNVFSGVVHCTDGDVILE